MHVHPVPRESGYTDYYLRDGDKYLHSYGKSPPTFYEPDFRLGYSGPVDDDTDDELETIPTGSIDFIIDDPPYGITNSECAPNFGGFTA